MGMQMGLINNMNKCIWWIAMIPIMGLLYGYKYIVI